MERGAPNPSPASIVDAETEKRKSERRLSALWDRFRDTNRRKRCDRSQRAWQKYYRAWQKHEAIYGEESERLRLLSAELGTADSGSVHLPGPGQLEDTSVAHDGEDVKGGRLTFPWQQGEDSFFLLLEWRQENEEAVIKEIERRGCVGGRAR